MIILKRSVKKLERFQQDHIDAFFRLNQDNRLLKRIFNGEYHQDMDELFSRYIFSQEENHMYLCMLAYSIDFNSEFTVISYDYDNIISPRNLLSSVI